MNYYSNQIPLPDITECFSRPNNHNLNMDIFIPDKTKQNGAAVIFIHGGGWHTGKRQQFLWHAHKFATRGYVASTIDYRLVQTAIYPAAVEDCQSAVIWLRRHADNYGIISDRIGVLGSSAGGHLAACMGVLKGNTNDVSARVNCVVDIHGIHDFTLNLDHNTKAQQICEEFIGGPLSETYDQWIQASPVFHVDDYSAPVLLIHDPDDKTVPYDQSTKFANTLMKAGRPLQLLPTPGSGHGFIYNPQNIWLQKIWPTILTWFDQHLLDPHYNSNTTPSEA
jgi:acetyl esterase/lipase